MSNRFLLPVLLLLGAGSEAAAQQLQVRAWQLHRYDIPHMRRAVDLAAEYDVTHIIFSHNIVWYTEELLYDRRRSEHVAQIAERAARRGLKSWIWTHEVHGAPDVPEQFKRDGRLWLDAPGFWDWLQDKYRQLFRRLPGIDGMILTFHETTYIVYRDRETVSELPYAERVRRLINAIYEVAREFDKELVVRTFTYEPEELEWLRDAIRSVDPAVMVLSKEVPHDWQPFYPHNPLIGAFPERKQLIEFHAAAEIGGYNMTPYPHPEYFKMRLDHALARGAYGYVARVDVGSHYTALGTPNELNLYTLRRLARDPGTPTGTIWRDWAEPRYGPAAAPHAVAALRRAFDLANRTFFTLGWWITNHTQFPTYDYATRTISRRTTAKWDPSPENIWLEAELNDPSAETLERILAEKDDALALARESLMDLERGRAHFAAEDYEDLRWRFQLALHAAIIWRQFNEAFFASKIYERERTPAWRQRVERALAALDRWADMNEAEYGEDIVPGNPERIRRFVIDVRAKLRALAAPGR